MGYDFHHSPEDAITSHCQAIDIHDSFELAGGVDLINDNLDRFKSKFNKPCYKDYTLAIQELKPDIIVVAVPTVNHMETIMTISNEYIPKILLMEKPLSYSVNEANQIIELAKKNNIQLAVNYFREYEPIHREFISRISSGEIGYPITAIAKYSKGLLNNGSHFLQFLSNFMGNFKKVEVLDKVPSLDNDDVDINARIHYEGGVVNLVAFDEKNFSIFEMDLIGPLGQIKYLDFGRTLELRKVIKDSKNEGYRKLSEKPVIIKTNIDKYQFYVYENLNGFLNSGIPINCDLEAVEKTIKIYECLLAK